MVIHLTTSNLSIAATILMITAMWRSHYRKPYILFVISSISLNQLSYRNCEAFMTLLKCVIGTGILSMPLAFKYCGTVGGVVMTILCTAVIIYGMQLLVSHICRNMMHLIHINSLADKVYG